MLKSGTLKLYGKLLMLAVLMACAVFFTTSDRVETVNARCGDDYCISQFNSCRQLYCDGQDCQPCINQYVGCRDVCPQPEGTPVSAPVTEEPPAN